MEVDALVRSYQLDAALLLQKYLDDTAHAVPLFSRSPLKSPQTSTVDSATARRASDTGETPGKISEVALEWSTLPPPPPMELFEWSNSNAPPPPPPRMPADSSCPFSSSGNAPSMQPRPPSPSAESRPTRKTSWSNPSKKKQLTVLGKLDTAGTFPWPETRPETGDFAMHGSQDVPDLSSAKSGRVDSTQHSAPQDSIRINETVDDVTRHLLHARDKIVAVEEEFAKIMQELAEYGKSTSPNESHDRRGRPAGESLLPSTEPCAAQHGERQAQYFAINTPNDSFHCVHDSLQ